MIAPSQLTYSGIVLAVLANQLCLPVPAIVFLMAGGALAVHGDMRMSMIVLLSVLSCLAADGLWFWFGRKWGSQAMRLLCSFTSDPRTCSRNAHEKFRRHGLPLLCVAKFFPGLDGLMPPLAGAEGVSLSSFLALDAVGSLLWSGFYVGLGYLFSDQLEVAIGWTKQFGTALGFAIGVPLSLYAAWRGLTLVRMIRRLQVRLISPPMLDRKLRSSGKVAVLDLSDFEEETGSEGVEAIPGAFRIDPSRMRQSPRIAVPDDVEIVLYCSSRRDIVSARVAVALEGIGVKDVWVLEGGLKSWRDHGFPVSPCNEPPEMVAERLGVKLPEVCDPARRDQCPLELQTIMTMCNLYDLAVIGAGPAGIVGATTAASLGARVVLIDRYGDLGGAGANTGTVPSKTLRETALALSGIRSRDLYGVDLSLRREATITDLMRREHAVKQALNRTLAQLVEASSVDRIVGDAQFEDSHTIVVRSGNTSNRIYAERILISTGSSPNRPASFPFDEPGLYDSNTILEMDKIPKSLAVVGAGAVGSEYACTFGALGMKVYLIDSRDVLLPFLDSEVSAALTEAMRRNGIHLHCGERVAECNRSGPEIRLMLQSGSVVRTEAVLVAAGRRSNTKYLNLAAAGLSSGERGDLIVDQHYRTAVPHIYAAGDVIGFPGLASTSMQQARRAMRVAFGAADDLPVRDIMPSAVYTIPEVAMVGDTEQAVREAGIDYVIGSARYSDNPRGCIIGEKEGFLKLILRRKDLKLLGVHAIGELASELVHIGLIAMSAGCDASVFSDLSFNVPTLGALYQDATWRLLNESRGVQTLPMPPAPNRRRALPGTTRIETAFPHPRTRGGCCWRELPNAKRDKTIQLSPGNPGARHSVFVLKAGFVT